MALRLSSPAFGHEQAIPRGFTCEGEDRSPPLEWQGVPAEARSLVLLVVDPDAPDPRAPKRTFTHWVLYDVPSNARALPEGAGRIGLPEGCRQGVNDFGSIGYRGPCPPIGRHRYFFKLYALDVPSLNLTRGARRDEVEEAMRGHILGQTELMGLYQRRTGNPNKL
jgi:Raf kinase inhibitor-like YbhB/YbcL family protein